MIDPTSEQIEKWENNGLVVKHIRLESSGENKNLQEQAERKDWKMNIDFDYTARDKPQQNYLAELGLLVLANKWRAMMYRENVPSVMRYQIFPKAF